MPRQEIVPRGGYIARPGEGELSFTVRRRQDGEPGSDEERRLVEFELDLTVDPKKAVPMGVSVRPPMGVSARPPQEGEHS